MTLPTSHVRLLRGKTEQQWTQDVMQAVSAGGWLRYHTHDSRHSAQGFPDEVLVCPPRVVFAELKTEQRKPTRDQLHWLALLDRCTQVESYLWRPSDLEEVWQVLAPHSAITAAMLRDHA